MSLAFSFEGGVVGAILAAAAILTAAWNWKLLRDRPKVLFFLRAAAILSAGALALEPSLMRMTSRSIKPKLDVLLDAGPTMGAKDGGARTRLARAAEWLIKNREAISSRADVALYAGADRARRIGWEDLGSLTPASASSDLNSSLQDVAADGAPSRLWLFSDGNSQTGELQRWRSPIDVLGVGPRRTARAVYLADLQTPDFVFLHSRFTVGVRFEASNLEGGAATARLWKGSALLQEVRMPVRSDYDLLSATFTASAESLGEERYRVEIAGEGGKSGASEGASAVHREFGVEVIRQKHRIMYLAGRPSPEYAQLRELLKSNPNFELVSFVILRNPENVSPVPDNELSLIPFPAQEIFVQNLMQFDMFILENFAYWRFNLPVAYLDALKRFVAQGGALLVIGGSNAFTQGGYRGSPLEDILPVTLWNSADDYVPGKFRPTPLYPGHPLLMQSESPESSAKLWAGLPDLDGYNKFSSIRPGSTVLLVHPEARLPSGGPVPVLAIRDYGKGKVMVLGTDSTWRWKLGGGQDWRIASFYGRFWAKAVQYLSGTLDLKKVKFSPLPERMPAREPAEITLHLFDESFGPLPDAGAGLTVVWTPPGGRPKTVAPHEKEPGVYQIELTGIPEGVQTLRAVARYRGAPWGEDEVRFRWETKAPESPLQRQWLSRVAEETAGRYSDLERVSASDRLSALPAVRTRPEVLRRWHLWTWGGWLGVILGLFAAEWALRRRWGYL